MSLYTTLVQVVLVVFLVQVVQVVLVPGPGPLGPAPQGKVHVVVRVAHPFGNPASFGLAQEPPACTPAAWRCDEGGKPLTRWRLCPSTVQSPWGFGRHLAAPGTLRVGAWAAPGRVLAVRGGTR
jgi:hypothetical protein